MASIAATVESRSTSLLTSHIVTLPTGIVAGHLLIIDVNFGNPVAETWPAGWTELFTGTNNFRKSVRYRIADGSEGASITITTPSTSRGIFYAARIIDEDSLVAPQVASASGSSANPDCPNLTPTGGALDWLWLTIYGWDLTGVTHSSYPTDYGLSQSSGVQTGTHGCGRGFAGRELNAASENPGTAGLSGTTPWLAVTIAVKPLGDIVTTPSPVSLPIVVLAPAISRDQFLNPSPIVVPLAVPAPSITTISLEPPATTIPIIAPAPVLSHALALAPSPVLVPISPVTPLLTFDQALAPAPVGIPLVVTQPTVSGASILQPVPVTIPLPVPAPAVVMGSLSISPSPRTIPLVVAAPLLIFNRIISPTPVAVSIEAVALSTGITGGGGIHIFTEHAPGLSYVYLYEPDGTLVSSTLTPLHYRINRYQNRVGDWSVDIPVDEIVGVLPVARQLGAGWKISIRQEGFNPNHATNEGFLLYQGIVETRQFKLGAGGQSMLSLTGSFRELSMVRRSIGLGYEYDTTLAGFTNDLVSTLLGEGDTAIYPAAASSIALSGVFTEPLSRYAAWLKGLASARYNVRESWDHDRPELTPYDGPPNPGIVLRKLYTDEDRYLHENGETGVGLIAGEPTIRYDGAALYNRIIAYGTDTVVDPADPTKTVTGSLTLEFATLASPYVVQNDVNPDGTTYYYVEDATSIALYGLIEHVLIRPDIKNPNDLSASRAQAADVLYWTAVNDLIKHRSEKVSINIGPLANGAHIWNLPGDQSWVKYEGEILLEGGAAVWLDLEKRFVLVERHDESHPSGVRRVDFILTAPEMEFEVGTLPEVINPFDPEGPTIPDLSFPPMPPFPEIPGLDLPELELPEIPGITEPNTGPPEGGGGGVVTGQLRLTEDNVVERWDGAAWENVEARLSTSDPGGGALWLEPP